MRIGETRTATDLVTIQEPFKVLDVAIAVSFLVLGKDILTVFWMKDILEKDYMFFSELW